MRTACKCRAYPDPEQASVLNRTFGCVRVAWNRTRAWRQARYRNAAKNILAAGLAVTACGADVRHPGTSRVRSAVKQEPRPVRAGIPVPQGGE
jgi:transposase